MKYVFQTIHKSVNNATTKWGGGFKRNSEWIHFILFNSFQNREIFFNILANRWRISRCFFFQKKVWANKKFKNCQFQSCFFHGDGRESDILSEYWGSSALEGVLVESSDEFTESALFNFLGFSWFICPINGGSVEEAKRLCLRALALKLGWRFACLLKRSIKSLNFAQQNR